MNKRVNNEMNKRVNKEMNKNNLKSLNELIESYHPWQHGV